ncbi:MAG: hypothetical protein J6W75_09030 [Bacteroidaceae bacterium]|nr:hypothetical protein [Bacteroidaceae bacterium]
MKHKYLSLIALTGAMFMSTSAWAQWTEPTEPVLEKKNVASVEAGKTYYIMNVGAGQFITGGNAWSTQISLTLDGVNSEFSPALAIYVADSTQTFSGSTCSGYSLRLDGTFNVNGANGARTFTNTYLFRDSEESGFIDHASQTKGYIWSIAKAENGFFRIQTAPGDPTFPEAATQFAGWDGTNGPIAVDEDGALIIDEETGLEPSTVVVFNMTEDQENAYIDWMFIDAAAYLSQLKAFEARKALYELLLSTTELDFEVDTKDATAVYENPNATKEELEIASNALKAAINRAMFEDLFSGASEDDPIDVTADVLENPDFETGDISGWTTNYVSGQQANNIGFQGSNYTNGDVTISRFIEAWKSDGQPWTIGDGYLQQTVYGLPKGKYVLEADAVSNYQWADHSADGGIGKNPTEGVYLFIKAGEYEAKKALSTGNGQPEHFSVTFINPGADELTFGLKTEGATANWIAADNFMITYYGFTDDIPEMAILKDAIRAAEDVDVYEPAYAADAEAFSAALEAAQDVVNVGGDAEACTAATEKLQAAMAQFKTSVEAYKKLYEFVFGGGLDEYIDKVGENKDWNDLTNQLDDLKEELQEAYEDCTITAAEIEEKITSVPQMIREFIKGDKVQEGTDVTILLNNSGFENGLEGWTKGRGDAWTVFEGVDYKEVESWHQNFDLYQVISDMPRGVYNISVQGFCRLDGIPEPTVELYAGNTTARFKSISTPPDEYSLEKLYDEGNFADTELTIEDEEGNTIPVYVPNGMAGAQVYFGMDNPLTGAPFYQNLVNIVLLEDGDLRIGVRSNSTQEWVLWDNFKITYLGQKMDAYYEMIDEAVGNLEKVFNATNAYITTTGLRQYNEVKAKAENKGSIDNADDALALLQEINEVAEYLTEGNKKGLELYDFVDIYQQNILAEIITGEESFPTMIEELAQALDVEGDHTTEMLAAVGLNKNEDFEAKKEEILAAWPAYIFYGVEDEPAKPADVSGIIYNPSYNNYGEGASFNGWSQENIGGAQAADFNEYECFNNDTIYVYQELQNLKPGYYKLAVQGFYRAGDYGVYTDSLATVHNSYISATTSTGEFAQPIKNITDGLQEGTVGAGSEVEITIGEGEEVQVFSVPNNMEAAEAYFLNEYYPNELNVLVGEDGKMTIAVKKTTHITNDWTIFTNWQLFYLGKTGQNFEEELVVVEGLKATNLNAAQLFSIDGRQQSSLRRGINIVRMADGSVRKVMVK